MRVDLVEGIKSLIRQGAVKADSVHNFCPVPMGALRGHPEWYTFASKDPRIRENAIRHTSNTIHLAAEIGASTVVSHSGNVEMKQMTEQLINLHEQREQYTPLYEKTELKLQTTRDKKARKQLRYLYDSLEKLIPVLSEYRIVLALENLPTWEAFLTELEQWRLFNISGLTISATGTISDTVKSGKTSA